MGLGGIEFWEFLALEESVLGDRSVGSSDLLFGWATKRRLHRDRSVLRYNNPLILG